MKNRKRKHLIILLTLFLALLGSGLNGFGQTHIYIKGTDTGTNSNFPNPPSGTPTDNIVTSFYAAISRANAVGNAIIHLRTNTLHENQPCPTISQNTTVQVINDTPSRKAIRFTPAAYSKAHRLIPVNGTLTLGGEGCTSVLIIRGQEDPTYFYPWNEDDKDPIVLIKANEGTVNIDNNCELCYGRVNVWISYRTGVVNLKPGGVIHSALDMNVNITQGTFNMTGGYIVGHYFSTGNTVPSYGSNSTEPTNRILDYDYFVNQNFTQGGTTDYLLDRYAVTDVLDSYYPLKPNDDKSKINNAMAVYIHDSRSGDDHLAKFNMSGGSICGFYGSGSKKVIIGYTGSGANYSYTYAPNADGTGTRSVQTQPIYCDGGEFNLSGTAKIYANHSHGAGGAMRITYWNLDKEDANENFDHAHMNMTGGEISYNSSSNGGAIRLELGSTLTMSAGKISHCTSVPTDAQMTNPDEGSGGGTGGIRMVSAKFVMSDDAEISWCNSHTISTGQSGGGIGAVWQNGFGNIATVIELNGGLIHHNHSRGYGGGIAATDKGNTDVIGGLDVKIQGCQIYNNTTDIDGGGLYIGGNTDVVINSDSEIHNNAATGNGGGVFISTLDPSSPCSLEIGSSEIYANTAVNGAGAYVHQGTFNLKSGAYIHDNDATTNGGGVFMDGGEFYHYAGEIGKEYGTNGATANTAVDGAGVYMDGGTYTMSGGSINGNKATGKGGGVYMGGGTFDFSSGRIGNGSGNYRNTANNGAGVYMADGGTFNMTGGSLEGNYASANGGGVYMASGGTCMVTGGTIGESSSNHNEAQYGAGIYSNGGNITINGGDVKYNVANISGGGIHCYSGTVYVTSGNITNNSATSNNGGGILANGTVYFSNGNINDNRAAINGGGVSINASGTLYVSGTAMMTGNNAASGYGGGVYQNGTMNIDGTALTISGNTMGSAKAQVANNVYLPNNKTIAMGSSLNAESVLLGIYTQNIANINEDIPVLTGSAAKCLVVYEALASGSSRITDDRNAHRPKYTTGDGIIYFTRVLYDYGPFTDGSPFQNPIDSREQLYKFMCYVNGVNGFTQKHSNQEGIVTADINMRGITHWVPIGEKENSGVITTAYTGTFNGNGHIISNLTIDELDDYSNYGLFGQTSNATITDIAVLDCNMTKNEEGNLGSIIGLMQGGTLKNSEGAGTLTSTLNTGVIGGLVGQMTAGTIHSSCAMPDMRGYQMGGLVGQMASGSNLYNSFANAKFTAQSGSTKYMGGLVGVNAGRIENCYARLQNASVPSSTYFGWIAGQNNSGTVTYCYIPVGQTVYVKNGTAQANTCTTYGVTQTPYLYMHADNQMTANGNNSYIDNGAVGTVVGGNEIALKGLLATLNNWVTLNGSTTYTKWMRTAASPINGDYPIHKFSSSACVASRDNIVLEYTPQFNDKFNEYITANTGTIYLYQTPAVLDATADAQANVSVSNYNKTTKLYIGEHAALKPTSGSKAAGDIIATVGVSLDNSAGAYGAHPTQGGADVIDWHMFSTSLEAAPLGVNYNGDTQEWPFSWGAPPTGMPAYQFFAEGNASHGYFPSKVYGTNADYYDDWDYYAYFEPEYHWINFKRNGNSHWHEDYTTVKINYKSNGTGADWTNETNLIKGRGYLIATKEPTFLQCSGTLAKGTISVDVTSGAWQRKGYNLLGNPYQSYLDFQKFAEKNKALWGITGTDYSAANYFILDEDQQGYIKYAYGASANTYTAPMYLHPHQGFMVIAESGMTVEFNETMRNTTATGVTFRDGVSAQPAYPLVNLIATEANGNRDICTVELGRPDKGGAPVQREMRISNGLIYCHYADADWGIAFTQPGITEVPIRFETAEDTEFTLTWDTENGDFSYMHLIDNMTGTDIDCLVTDEYKFAAHQSDYASRFRLVFDYTGVGENGDDISENDNFAFQMGDELIVNGEGTLQLFDMTGRLMMETRVSGTQSAVTMPAVSQGIYLLRLTTRNVTKTQKIVLR